MKGIPYVLLFLALFPFLRASFKFLKTITMNIFYSAMRKRYVSRYQGEIED